MTDEVEMLQRQINHAIEAGLRPPETDEISELLTFRLSMDNTNEQLKLLDYRWQTYLDKQYGSLFTKLPPGLGASVILQFFFLLLFQCTSNRPLLLSFFFTSGFQGKRQRQRTRKFCFSAQLLCLVLFHCSIPVHFDADLHGRFFQRMM